MWEVLVLLYRNEKNPYTLCWLAYATRKNVIGVDNNPYVHSLLIGLCEEKERDWCRQQSICSLFVDWLRWKEKERVISFSEWGRNVIGLESNSPVCRPSFSPSRTEVWSDPRTECNLAVLSCMLSHRSFRGCFDSNFSSMKRTLIPTSKLSYLHACYFIILYEQTNPMKRKTTRLWKLVRGFKVSDQ